MHDIDRTLMEYTPEMEDQEQYPSEYTESEWDGESAEVFDENELMELVAELLDVTNETELNYFLGNLIKKAGSILGKAVKSPVGQALGGILKGAARKALPMIGSAVGGYVAGSGGAKLGGQLASRAGQVMGLETEGLSHEDEIFEVAKQYVRFAGDAVKNAVATPQGDPKAVAQAAVAQAAQRYAPGLLRSPVSSPAATDAAAATQVHARGGTGRWIRRGNRIILFGV